MRLSNHFDEDRRMKTALARLAWIGLGLAVGLSLTARWNSVHALDEPKPKAKSEPPPKTVAPLVVVSLQDALYKPMDLPFEKPTALEKVQEYLAEQLHAQVLLDRAALGRLKLTPETTVEMGLKGVRLKTGLRILLDQVGMTFKVEPEDNLLILTDSQGTEDANARILTEIKALHREMHDVQDAVDELFGIFDQGEPEAEMRNPTIIEEVPPRKGEAVDEPEPKKEPGPGEPQPEGKGRNRPKDPAKREPRGNARPGI